jgi:hypothetical protein
MATTPSNIRSLTSVPDVRSQSEDQVTPVTRRRGSQRQPARILFALSREPEDARITGGTRSLDRRLLALNLSRSHSGSTAA